jgi:glucose/arabinose dehydrogenase
MRLVELAPAFLLGLFAVGAPTHVLGQTSPVPEVVAGFAISPLATVPVPTALAFGPGGLDGPDLYVTSLSGDVFRVEILWTPLGPVATGTSTFVSEFSQPLGLAFGDDGVLYVSDSHPGAESGRTDGRLTRVVNGAKTVIVDGIPNGRHNTNHLRFGPDGLLYIANGNPNDSGCPDGSCVGGDPDVFPYSGAVLFVNAKKVSADPAVLHWIDKNGDPIPPDEIAHPRNNHDFRRKVRVYASGFRNIFGVAFAPPGLPYAGDAYTAMNGADDPSSQDPLYRITPGVDYRYPFCYNVGPAGGTGAEVTVSPNPLFPDADCSTAPPATALLGWHVCATGLDFPTQGLASFPAPFQSSVYVAECTPFFPDPQSVQDPLNASHNTSHKVARVELDANGEAVRVSDFVTGLVLATDVLFGPDGAMYIADAEQIFRVAPVAPGL